MNKSTGGEIRSQKNDAIEQVMMISNGSFIKIKKIHLVVVIISALISIGGAFVYPFVWKSQIDKQVEINTKDIYDLKIKQTDIDRKVDKIQVDTAKKIDEISFNLRNYLESKGFRYITLHK